jgi:hypothetical protein
MLRAARGLQGEEVSDVQGSGRLPVTLAVHVDDGSVWAFLTDGRSQARQGRACWSVEPSQTTGPAQAARALAADPGAARTYFEQFLPGPVGQWLRASPPRTLNLQIPAALDAVPWECLHDGRSALGQRRRPKPPGLPRTTCRRPRRRRPARCTASSCAPMRPRWEAQAAGALENAC